MTRSSILPTLALTVAMGSMFAPPVLGVMGIVPAPAPRESALLVENQDGEAVAATASRAYTRHSRTVADQCPVVGATDRAPPPPGWRTVVAALASPATGR